MNKEWSELNKTMQTELKKRGTFNQGIFSLMKLRDELWNTILSLKNELSSDEFNAIPFINAEGYHSKTIAYSLWHVFRIEDIVAHTLVAENQQVFFKGDYQKRINAPIITTGNELVKQEIADFVEFWTEKLPQGTDYLMYPQNTAIVNRAMPIQILPKPDSMERMWFVFVTDDGRSVKEPKTEAIKRNAYAVVEWGGIIADE